MIITAIEPDSYASDIDLKIGDVILSINGHTLNDELDYQFYVAEEIIELVYRVNGELLTTTIEKYPEEDLGLTFTPMKIRACANDCVFCFAKQNPPGVRESLNFKDGDYRFSFLHGHYVTLTNMGKRQLARVVEQRLSPLYVSAHVTNVEARKKYLLFGKDDHFLDKLNYLTSNGIVLHTQIVVTPNWNDGELLTQTLEDLFSFQPHIETVSVVPIGLTKWRENQEFLKPITDGYAKNMIELANEWDTKYVRQDGHRFIYLSDEWFIRAGIDIPEADYYDEFLMVENGVGQCRDFANRFFETSANLPKKLKRPTKLTFTTGKLPFDFLMKTIGPALDKIENLAWELIPIANERLGADLVTVTGLLSASDIINGLNNKDLGDAVYVSQRMFNDDDITLDDLTIKDMEMQLGVPVFKHEEDLLETLEKWV
jgi:putative radical SAM enzyme (TIGR03279 family)